jgi:hypothetical protein
MTNSSLESSRSLEHKKLMAEHDSFDLMFRQHLCGIRVYKTFWPHYGYHGHAPGIWLGIRPQVERGVANYPVWLNLHIKELGNLVDSPW